MQYLLLINEDESIYEGEEGAKLMEDTLAKHMALGENLTKAGIEFSGNRLQPRIDRDHDKMGRRRPCSARRSLCRNA